MNEKILQEVLDWYKNKEEKSDVDIADFIDFIINKTTDTLFDEIQNELKNEFENGNLKHTFMISSDYYLDLKLKEIKAKCIKHLETDTPSENKNDEN